MSKKLKTIFLWIGIILLGFIREYLFANTNWIYLHLINGRMNQARGEFHFLLNWSPSQINGLKWCMTLVFIGLFYLLTRLIMKVYFQNKNYLKITTWFYIGLLAIAAFIYALTLAVGASNELYGILRTLVGWAQSFLPAMILFLLFKYLPEQKLAE